MNPSQARLAKARNSAARKRASRDAFAPSDAPIARHTWPSHAGGTFHAIWYPQTGVAYCYLENEPGHADLFCHGFSSTKPKTEAEWNVLDDSWRLIAEGPRAKEQWDALER